MYPWGNDPAQGCPFANGFDRTTMAVYAGMDTTGYKVFDPVDAQTAGSTQPGWIPGAECIRCIRVVGNVAEWVEDCHSPSHELLTESGDPPPIAGTCERRVVKGGSWGTLAHNLRTAERVAYSATHRNDSIWIASPRHCAEGIMLVTGRSGIVSDVQTFFVAEIL